MKIGGNTLIVPSLIGTATVCCIHQRQKREITDLKFDRSKEFVQLCPCCENLFTTTTDEPMFCQSCGNRPVPQGGLNQLAKGVGK